MQDSSNNATSLLISKQLPAFVREEHDTFVAFLEYYYKFLEQDGQMLYVAKNFNRFLDIDQIKADIDGDTLQGDSHILREEGDYHAFLQKMYNNYITYIPDNILANKSLILKHAKEFYRSRGTERSLKFLMRAFTNKEISFYYPKTDILKASDGKWFIEKSLKVTNVYADNVANGTAVTRFANASIKGVTSGASAIVERVDTYYDRGQLIYELKLSSISKEFINAENIWCLYTEEGVNHYLTATLFAGGTITAVTLGNGGTGYSEGTSVPINSSYGSGAQIVITKVSKGTIQAGGVVVSGAGFKINDPLVISGDGNGATGYISNVDKTGFYHPNSYNVIWTTISLVANNVLGNVNNNVYETFAYSNLAAVYTNTSNLKVNTGSGTATTINLSFWMANSNVYFETQDSINVGNTIVTVTSTNLTSNVITISPGLPGGLISNTLQIIKRANVNTTIANAVSYFAYSNCGPVLSLVIDNGGQNYKNVSMTISANSIISKLGILGKMSIISGGVNYKANDKIEFINPFGSTGSGAYANVVTVNATGAITNVAFIAQKGQIVGGSGYEWLSLPTANVITTTGSGANIAVTAVIGHNEKLIQSVSNIGTIQSITIITGGSGYSDNPTLALNKLGDGTATAELTTVTGAYSYPGRYITDDGHISGFNFLEDRDYYQQFSYVVRVDETTNKYREAVKSLTHPAGSKMFGEYLSVNDSLTDTNTNLTVTYANTESNTNFFKSYYQVQGFANGVFSPNVSRANARSEFVVGTYKVNTTNHMSTFAAQNNWILINYPSHNFFANDYIFLYFVTNNWANLANTVYVVTSSNTDYIYVTNPLTETAIGNSNGSVKVWNPDVTLTFPYSAPDAGTNAFIQFQTTDPALANGLYYVYEKVANSVNVLHPNMFFANDSANVANIITKKITITANNHEYNVGDRAYIQFLGGDTANTKNSHYTVAEVGSNNTMNVYASNIIFTPCEATVFKKRSNIVITNHAFANGNTIYVSFTSNDQSNTVNAVYQPIKTGSSTLTMNVPVPATGNCNVRVWYSQNNYSNIVFTTPFANSRGIVTTPRINVFVEFNASAADLANGVYAIKNVYGGSNTYNIFYNANTYVNTIHANSYSNNRTYVLESDNTYVHFANAGSIAIANAGNGVSNGYITFTGGSGTGLSALANVSNTTYGNVTSVTIVNRGSGYLMSDNVTGTISGTNFSGNFNVIMQSDKSNTINYIAYSGVGVKSNSVMEGIAWVSQYK